MISTHSNNNKALLSHLNNLRTSLLETIQKDDSFIILSSSPRSNLNLTELKDIFSPIFKWIPFKSESFRDKDQFSKYIRGTIRFLIYLL